MSALCPVVFLDGHARFCLVPDFLCPFTALSSYLVILVFLPLYALFIVLDTFLINSRRNFHKGFLWISELVFGHMYYSGNNSFHFSLLTENCEQRFTIQICIVYNTKFVLFTILLHHDRHCSNNVL